MHAVFRKGGIDSHAEEKKKKKKAASLVRQTRAEHCEVAGLFLPHGHLDGGSGAARDNYRKCSDQGAGCWARGHSDGRRLWGPG